MGRYILDGQTPVPCEDVEAWARWVERTPPSARRVGRAELVVAGVDYLVSTVFLMLDHNFGGRGPPLLFETMVFQLKTPEERLDSRHDLGEDVECWRYSSWDDAAAGHQAALNRLQEKVRADG